MPSTSFQQHDGGGRQPASAPSLSPLRLQPSAPDGCPASHVAACDPSSGHGTAMAPSEEILAIFRRNWPEQQLEPVSYAAQAPDPVRQWHPPILMPSTMRALQQSLGAAAAEQQLEPLPPLSRRHRSQLAAALAAAASAADQQEQAQLNGWLQRPIGWAAPAA
ncbi:hypothetical protein D9Q98_001315 [Chlorella vulgaris]|uniref:Uncharacterized protein n=1 Tax=Chlorella vulgaris TaxID=3077 RepID=A0A9D4U0F5_CHLVU|nr:hypothetical protein D9Q98_001315 [Chlorella vulgaris]